MIGIVTLDQLAAEHPHQVGAEVELGYMLLPQAWGFGYAAEACAGALDWFAEVKRFEEYGAEQWLGILPAR